MNIFREATSNIHDYIETVSDYISWCASICVPSKTVRVFLNQKPWFYTDIRTKIRKRQEAFNASDSEEYKRARYEVQRSIRAAKKAHSQKLESFYLQNNTHTSHSLTIESAPTGRRLRTQICLTVLTGFTPYLTK